MKNKKYAMGAFLVIIVFGLVIISGCSNNNDANNAISNNNNNAINSNNKNNLQPDFETVSTGSTDTGDALVDLTPKGMENGKFVVDASINTHSVDLDQFDLTKITSLEYEGKAIKPLSAPKLSGHHNSGALSFDTGKEIKNFKIIIKGIPAVEERIFEWN